jgi:RluA family pseudouridine synthase
LKKLFINATRALIYKFNRKWKIKVKQVWDEWFKKRDNEFKIWLNDEIKLFLSDKDIKELTIKKPIFIETSLKKSFNKKDIVFEDGDLFIINKSSWINVHPWDFKSKEVSIIQQVQDYLWQKLNSLTFKPSLVHRIDRDTSWILIIAKKKDILTKLVEDFKNHKKIKKTYLAICFWKLPQKSWTITKKLLRIENAQNRNKVEINEKWQIAISHYKLVEEFIIDTKNWKQNISVVEVQIETGRMHQIRVHLASIKCPIIWDKAYWNKSLNHYFEREFQVKRQMLHAYKIEFFHYWRKKNMELQAKMKKDMQSFLEKIK